jgi:hypothetical protein
MIDIARVHPLACPLANSRFSEYCLAPDESINEGVIPENMEAGILNDFRVLCKASDETVTMLSVTTKNKEIKVADNVVELIDLALVHEEECYGSIEGRLESINVHGGSNTFTIYPVTGAENVSCKFPDKLENKAIDAIKRNILVSGLLRYRRGENFPYRINVEDIQIYDWEKDLPSLLDLRGLAPNATGEKSSEQFVRELRDGWEG